MKLLFCATSVRSTVHHVDSNNYDGVCTFAVSVLIQNWSIWRWRVHRRTSPIISAWFVVVITCLVAASELFLELTCRAGCMAAGRSTSISIIVLTPPCRRHHNAAGGLASAAEIIFRNVICRPAEWRAGKLVMPALISREIRYSVDARYSMWSMWILSSLGTRELHGSKFSSHNMTLICLDWHRSHAPLVNNALSRIIRDYHVLFSGARDMTT